MPLTSTNFTRSSLKRVSFNCIENTDKPRPGELKLNQYLKQFAFSNNDQGLAKTFVILSEDKSEILGYYSSSANVIDPSSIPNPPNNLPAYPVPVFLIGRLAVDCRMQRKGIGNALLLHALTCAIEISEQTGIYAIRVDPIDEMARSYYTKKSFLGLNHTLNVYLSIKSVREARARAKA